MQRPKNKRKVRWFCVKRRIRKDGWCQRGNRTPLENQMFVRIFSFHYLIWCYNYLHSEYLIIPLIKWGAIVVVVVCKLELQLPVQTGPISTKVSSNLVHGEVYSIQHYVIKLVSDFRQVCGLLWVRRFPPPIKLTATI